ncbi:MAG TPA: DNA repair protein RecO [Candidatus Dormibacteraeota bacterium]|nr:DNA repair protein RecO [Candidatus Dormibacteraeota bacterium]
MPSYVDEGIVLRRVDYAEADRVLTVLTRHHGKVGVLARGVRRAGSRLAAHTDLFTRSTLQLARGRGELEVLTEARHLGSVASPGDARRAACSALCAEIADCALEPGHPLDEGLYDLVVQALDGCADPAGEPRPAVVWFARRLIDRLGYGPELHACASCGDRLAERPARFSAAGGGLLCPRCAPGDPEGVDCSVTVIKVLRVTASGDAGLFARLRLTPEVLTVLEAVMERELAGHIGRRLRSLEVLRALI